MGVFILVLRDISPAISQPGAIPRCIRRTAPPSGMLGEFYGPAAEEVGGVFTATRDEDQRVLYGALHGQKR